MCHTSLIQEFIEDHLTTGWRILTLVMLSQMYSAFTNSVDPDQLASEEANWSGSALFAIKYVNL